MKKQEMQRLLGLLGRPTRGERPEKGPRMRALENANK